jgi:hypothetical protein
MAGRRFGCSVVQKFEGGENAEQKTGAARQNC